MGWFDWLFGKKVTGVDKNELIRRLAKIRVQDDKLAQMMGMSEIFDSLSNLELAGIPEATIVNIVETWSVLSKKGVPDEEIFRSIEEHRSVAFASGEMPNPLTLERYVCYRVQLELDEEEHPEIENAFIVRAVSLVRELADENEFIS